MMWYVCILALALAPGLESANTVGVITLPGEIEGTIPIQNFPAFIVPDVEVEIEAHPMPIAPVINPCDACFEYMTELIDQLTSGTDKPVVERPVPEVIEPELPEMPELGVPAPETIELHPEFVIVPHPIPGVQPVESIPSSYLRV